MVSICSRWSTNTDERSGLVSVVDSTSVSKLKYFTYYSSAIASATPSGTNKASYTPTNSALQSCPAVSTAWKATQTPLPPTPNEELCNCMDASAGCVVKDSLSSSKYSDLFGVVCGYTDCDGLTANATTGKYGAYSVCDAKQQLSFVMDLYYQDQSDKSQACDFDGKGETQDATEAKGTCASLMKDAGKNA